MRSAAVSSASSGNKTSARSRKDRKRFIRRVPSPVGFDVLRQMILARRRPRQHPAPYALGPATEISLLPGLPAPASRALPARVLRPAGSCDVALGWDHGAGNGRVSGHPGGGAGLFPGNWKIPSENLDDIVPCLRQTADQFGGPDNLLHDLSSTMSEAREQALPGVPHFVCHSSAPATIPANLLTNGLSDRTALLSCCCANRISEQ